jgi:hypothetical protein
VAAAAAAAASGGICHASEPSTGPMRRG